MEEIKGQISVWDIEAPKLKVPEILNNKNIEIGDTVKVQYNEREYTGKVVNIYGPGKCTLNVIFDNKHTAFYKDNVKLVC